MRTLDEILKHLSDAYVKPRAGAPRNPPGTPCPRVFMPFFQFSVHNQQMHIRLDRTHRFAAVLLGVVTLAGVAALLVWDLNPRLFPPGSHDLLAAFPLAIIAIAYLVYQAAHRPSPQELLKAILLAIAFLLWAANQFWPDWPSALLLNDLAIALFVLDVFLVLVGWPATSPDEDFAETYAAPSRDRDGDRQ